MLTVEELREHVGDGPSDDVLERFLEAAIQALDERFGPELAYDEETSDRAVPYRSLVYLSRRAQSISSVTEDGTVLDVSEYEMRSAGKSVQRLDADGEPTDWSFPVDVTFTPYMDDAERDRVCIKLVELDLDYAPGMTGSTVGPWSEQHPQGDEDYRRIRESILRSFKPAVVGIW